MKKQIKVNAISYAHLVKAMMMGDMNCQELAEETGLHLTTVYQYTRELHAVGAAHIVRFDPDDRGRKLIKVYKIGEGKDAKRIPMTEAERQHRRRQLVKAQQQLAVVAGKGRYVLAANGRLRFEEVAA